MFDKKSYILPVFLISLLIAVAVVIKPLYPWPVLNFPVVLLVIEYLDADI